MAQTLTLISTLALALVAAWYFRRHLARPDTLHVSIRLDHSAPGAHLLWNIVNASQQPITLTQLAIHPSRHGDGRGEQNATVPLGMAERLQPGDHAVIPTDVDWRVLSARSVAVCDDRGLEHPAPADELAAIQDTLHGFVDRRSHENRTARDWLSGATNLAFGIVILGLGFFMLMWVIATG
jgi:hypothetical protein